MKATGYAVVVLGSFAALAAAATTLAVWMGERKMARTVDVRVVPVAFTRDPAAARLGKYLFETRGCAECHGADGRGRVMIDEPDGLYVRSPDITPSPSGAVSGYGEADWVRAIRHGVSPAGRALLFMPSEDYNRLTDGDFAALTAYVRGLPPAAGDRAAIRMPLVMKALYGVGAIRDAAQKIDHRLPPTAPVPVAATVEHGAYAINMCIGCHGPGLAGGRIPGAPRAWPAAANLTPGEGSVMPRYDTPEKFAAMMRSGKRPDGTDVSAAMPFASLRNLSDVDLRAMYAYLGTLAPRQAGER